MRTHLPLYCTAFLLCRPAIAAVTPNGNQLWHLDQALIAGPADGVDGFGWSLSVGDYDGDGHRELAIGFFEDVDGDIDTGAVAVLTSGIFDDGFESDNTSRWSATTP